MHTQDTINAVPQPESLFQQPYILQALDFPPPGDIRHTLVGPITIHILLKIMYWHGDLKDFLFMEWHRPDLNSTT